MHLSRVSAIAVIAALGITFTASASPSKVDIKMGALNKSNETGSATLEQVGNDLKITVKVDNAPKDLQPTHIHAGTCGKLNPAPEYPLSNLDNGTSVTVLKNVKLSSLAGKYSINVHKSSEDLATYVSCGEIK